ncbi:MAG: hypothetical protein U0T82_02070 [Bacteroidales bacterium]
MDKLFAAFMAVLLLLSCKEEIDPGFSENDAQLVAEYLPMQIGNYWIYQHYSIDSAGQATPLNRIDSIVISRDSSINGHTYFVFEKETGYPGNPREIESILRDSAGTIVDQHGKIRFAVNNFSDTIYRFTHLFEGDTIYILSAVMERLTAPISVPAGTFEALNLRSTVRVPYAVPGVKYPRYFDNCYSRKIGKIVSGYFYLNSPVRYEKRLIRYRVDSGK